MKRRMEFGDYVNPMSWIGAPKKTLWTTSEWNMLCSESCLIDFRLNWPRKTPTTVGHYSLEWIWPLPLDIWPQVVATRALIMPSEFYTTASPSLWKRHARWLLFGCLGQQVKFLSLFGYSGWMPSMYSRNQAQCRTTTTTMIFISITLMAPVDADFRLYRWILVQPQTVLYITSRSYVSVYGRLGISQPEPLSGDDRDMAYFIVGDNIISLENYFMKPILQNFQL